MTLRYEVRLPRRLHHLFSGHANLADAVRAHGHRSCRRLARQQAQAASPSSVLGLVVFIGTKVLTHPLGIGTSRLLLGSNPMHRCLGARGPAACERGTTMDNKNPRAQSCRFHHVPRHRCFLGATASVRVALDEWTKMLTNGGRRAVTSKT